MSATIVCDINLFTDAVGGVAAEEWSPAMVDALKNKKTRGSFSRMVLQVLSLDAQTEQRYRLVGNDHIIDHIAYWLNTRREDGGYGWSGDAAEGYVNWVNTLATETGGDANYQDKGYDNSDLVNIVPDSTWRTAGAEVDHEDRRVVALARESGATVIITNDANFLKLGDRLGYVRIMDPATFLQEHVGYRN